MKDELLNHKIFICDLAKNIKYGQNQVLFYDLMHKMLQLSTQYVVDSDKQKMFINDFYDKIWPIIDKMIKDNDETLSMATKYIFLKYKINNI